jgi:hypothetical protein
MAVVYCITNTQHNGVIKRKSFILVHGSGGLIFIWVTRQHILMGVQGGANCSPHKPGSKEIGGRGWSSKISFKGMSPVT